MTSSAVHGLYLTTVPGTQQKPPQPIDKSQIYHLFHVHHFRAFFSIPLMRQSGWYARRIVSSKVKMANAWTYPQSEGMEVSGQIGWKGRAGAECIAAA